MLEDQKEYRIEFSIKLFASLGYRFEKFYAEYETFCLVLVSCNMNSNTNMIDIYLLSKAFNFR